MVSTMEKSNVRKHEKVTAGRRRRKKQLTHSTPTDIDKENRTTSTGFSSGGKGQDTVGIIDDDAASMSIILNTPDLPTAGGDDILTETCQKFRLALKGATVNSSSLWKEHPELVNIVVDTSLSARRRNNAFLHLDEHSSTLLSISRKLIKEATDVDKSKISPTSQNIIDTNIFVAVHILRSLAFVLADTATVDTLETLLKLFYHLITTAAEWVQTPISATRDNTLMVKCSFIAMAGYEGLGYVLSKYSIQQPEHERVTEFELQSSKILNKKNILFAIPRDNPKTKNNKNDLGSMKFRQLCTIAIKTTTVIGKSLNQVISHSKIIDLKSLRLYSHSSLSKAVSGQCNVLHRILIEIMQRVHKPWTTMLAKTSVIEKDAMKDVVAFSKGVHRILWDTASKLKMGQVDTSIEEIVWEEECLELRKNAILLLLPVTSIVKVDLMTSKMSFDSACSYTWKASTAFIHRSSDSYSIEPVTKFYIEMDNTFHQFLILDIPVPLSYVEYFGAKCRHVTLSEHTDLPNGLTRTNNVSNRIGNVDFNILLRFLEIGFYIKRFIDSSLDKNEEEIKQSIIRHRVDNAILKAEAAAQDFVKSMYGELSTISFDDQNRILKVLSSLSIQTTLFVVTNESPTVLILIRKLLKTAAKVLEIIGSFVLSVFRLNSEQVSEYVDLIVESHIRPISIYEKISIALKNQGSEESAVFFMDLSNELCEKLYQVLTDVNPAITFLEKAAKFLSKTARYRSDNWSPETSLLPLRYAIKLYIKLDLKSEDCSDHQLPSRLLILFKTLQTVGKTDESFIAACLFLYMNSASHDSHHYSQEVVLDNLASKCNAIFPPILHTQVSSANSDAICRVIAAYIAKTKNFGKEDMECSPTEWRMFGESLERSFDYIFKHDTAHPGVSLRSLFNSGKNLTESRSTRLLLSFLEVLAQLGQSIQRLAVDGKESEAVIDIALCNFSYFETIVRKFVDSIFNSNIHLFDGLVGLLAASSLVSRPDTSFFTLTNFPESASSQLIIGKAVSIVEYSIALLETEPNNSINSSRSSLSSIVRLALTAFLFSLQNKWTITQAFVIKDVTMLIECTNLVETLSESNVSDEDFVSLRRRWALWTMIIVKDSFVHCDLKNKATILSLWTSSSMKNDVLGMLWYDAVAMMACIEDGNQFRVTNDYLISTRICLEDTTMGSLEWLFKIELQLCQLHVAAMSFGAESEETFDSHLNVMEDIQTEMHRCELDENDPLFTIYLWVLSTFYFVSSDIAIVFRRYPYALESTHACLRYCQAVKKRGIHCTTRGVHWSLAAATSTVCGRASLRYINILCKRPKLYYRLGDHRKAGAYTRSTIGFLKNKLDSADDYEEMNMPLDHLVDSLYMAPEIRLVIEVKSWASTPDDINHKLVNLSPTELIEQTNCGMDTTTAQNTIRDLITVGDVLYADSITTCFNKAFLPFYQEATNHAETYARILDVQSMNLPLHLKKYLGSPSTSQIQIRRVRQLFEAQPRRKEPDVMSMIQSICLNVNKSKLSCPEDKAWALYYLGRLELDLARKSGALQELWSEDRLKQDESEDVHLCRARQHLSQAGSHTANVSDVLTRNILRSLALALGPFKAREGITMSSAVLVLASVGQSLRRRMSWSFRNIQNESNRTKTQKGVEDIFETFSAPLMMDEAKNETILAFFNKLAEVAPSAWSFAAPVICPSGELLIARVEKDRSDKEYNVFTTCVFPRDKENAYDDIVKPFDSILMRTQEQLHRKSPIDLSEEKNTEGVKKQWWLERNQLDEELKVFLKRVESIYFADVFNYFPAAKQTKFQLEDEDEFPRGNLASKFEAALNEDDDQSSEYLRRVNDLKYYTIPRLKAKLREKGVEEYYFKKMRKADIIDLIIQQDKEQTSDELDCKSFCGREETGRRDECLFLILDENLHRLPFEGMTSLQTRTVCRVPCLSFVLAKLYELELAPERPAIVNPTKISYVLDPEQNLRGTRNRILPVIESLSKDRNWKWDGVVGELPSSNFFINGLNSQDGLMMYFGHGGAQTCFSRRQVEELINDRVSSLQDINGKGAPRSTVILMGCSSGRLVSINRKNSEYLEQSPLFYEPEGIALSYLCAGAPCVIGNLWDVTDNDIDRFSISLLDDFLGNHSSEGASSDICLAGSVSRSRSACKLKYLVGCAPVCYGIPIFRQ